MISDGMNNDRFQVVARNAAAQLVSFNHTSNGGYVTTPLLYSSGSYVVVRIEGNGDRYFVSDFGAGLQEAEMMGGEAIYRRVAKQVSEANGVQFDSFAFFALYVSEGQLPGAIATIANSSQEAVNLTTLRLAERNARDNNAALYDRLTAIFSPKFVAKNAQLVGASNTEWHVASLVNIDGRQVAFESVTNNPTSVAFAAAKFGDIRLLPKAPGRVAVVPSKKAMGTYLGVLSQTGNVIERADSDHVFQRLLEAA